MPPVLFSAHQSVFLAFLSLMKGLSCAKLRDKEALRKGMK